MAGRPIGKAWHEARRKARLKRESEPIPASVADELTKLRAVAEAAKKLACPPPPGMRHDPNCILCVALAALEEK